MPKITRVPVALLTNPDPIQLHSNTLIEMLEHGSGTGSVPLTFLESSSQEVHRTHDDLLCGARIVATYLRNRGLRKGDKVVILLMTSRHFTDSFFGTILAGGIPVPTSPPLTFGDIGKYIANLTHIVNNSEARFMIAFPRIRRLLGTVLASASNLKELILAKEIKPEAPLVPGFPSLDGQDPAFIQYTSGTTGMPKGVVLTHRAVLSNVYGIVRGIDCRPTDSSVSWLPLFHDMGLIGGMMTALYTGAHLYAMAPESFVMNPIAWLKNLTRYRATIAVAPNFAYRLLANRVRTEELQSLDLSSLKVALNGAEPVDLQTLKVFEDRFECVGFRPNVSFPVYGLAENCLAATFPVLGTRFEVEPMDRSCLEIDGKAVEAHAGDRSPFQAISVGAPVAGQQVAVKAPGGGFAQEREVGEVLIKGPSLMTGYYRNEGETARVFNDGWLSTGDLGFILRGRLFITGRAKEIIIKRGRNYYPYDIERAAARVKGVRKGCLVAFASPNPEAGTEDIVLMAETSQTDPFHRRRIEHQMAAEVLSDIGVKPDRIHLIPPRTIPKTSSGKLQRLLCRQRYHDGSLLKSRSQQWLTPLMALVSSFVGHQRFRLRARDL
ncbi:MAG: fatty acyl-AMP ligase [Acidobacteriota bacterium]